MQMRLWVKEALHAARWASARGRDASTSSCSLNEGAREPPRRLFTRPPRLHGARWLPSVRRRFDRGDGLRGSDVALINAAEAGKEPAVEPGAQARHANRMAMRAATIVCAGLRRASALVRPSHRHSSQKGLWRKQSRKWGGGGGRGGNSRRFGPICEANCRSQRPSSDSEVNPPSFLPPEASQKQFLSKVWISYIVTSVLH